MPERCFTLHNDVKCNGGCAKSGDVVSFKVGEQMHMGELLISVGIHLDGQEPIIYANIAKWAVVKGPPSTTPEDLCCLECLPKEDEIVKVDVRLDLDTVSSYRMADDRSSCMLLLLYECRRQSR